MNITLDLLSILQTYKKVTIPQVGSFILKYRTARIDEEKHKIDPPGGEIIFDNRINEGDEIILEFYVKNYPEKSVDEIKTQLASHLAKIINDLDQQVPVIFQGLGTLKKSTSGRIEFEAVETSDILPETFGLKPIELDENQPIKSSDATLRDASYRKKNYTWLVIVVLLFVVGGFAVVFFTDEVRNIIDVSKDFTKNIFRKDNVKENENYQYKVGSFKQDTGKIDKKQDPENKDIKEETEILNNRLDAETSFKNALFYEETIDKVHDFSKFYIIAGSFTNMDNAVKLQSQLRLKGYDPEILKTEDDRFRVTLNSYENRTIALEELKKYKMQEKSLDIWLLSL